MFFNNPNFLKVCYETANTLSSVVPLTVLLFNKLYGED
jgi:hypothetical protein